ncbi:MAG TPA: long-chain fatty acid--CoA ligase [Pseudomonadales bacterium]
MTFKAYQNTHQMFKAAVEHSPTTPAYRWFDSNLNTQGVSWTEFSAQVDQVSKSLLALGVKKNDKVSILSNSCYHWALTDLGTVSMGAVTVGIYQSNLAKDCEYIINHSDSVLVFAEDQGQLAKLIDIKQDISNVIKVVLFQGESANDWVLSYKDFLDLGRGVDDAQLEIAQNNVQTEDIATIVYTSGTTGVPKGAMLSHGNITFTTQSILQSVDVHEGDTTLLFLPLAHVFARAILYAGLYANTVTYFNRNLDTLLEDFKLSKPHWFASVPRIYEKVYGKVNSGAEAKGGIALKLFHWACDLGAEVSKLRLEKKSLPVVTALKYQLASKLVFSKLHEAFGGRLRWCISGAAPMNPSIARFFDGAGIPILEGIGMTENTSFSNLNRINNYRFGSVGQAGPGIEVKVATDGEFMVRGPNVMQGYYKMPEETEKNITGDGWLLTGDLASIDDEGFVTITGRKKDLIITSGGKNVAPSAIEGLMALSKYINQVCVIGDKRKYLTALVTLDLEAVKEYCQVQGIDYINDSVALDNVQIQALIEDEINVRNQELPSYETIKKFALVPEFTIENEALTPTLKVKRNVVMEQYADKIEAMYQN